MLIHNFSSSLMKPPASDDTMSYYFRLNKIFIDTQSVDYCLYHFGDQDGALLDVVDFLPHHKHCRYK